MAAIAAVDKEDPSSSVAAISRKEAESEEECGVGDTAWECVEIITCVTSDRPNARCESRKGGKGTHVFML
jgi:hypothetical protein